MVKILFPLLFGIFWTTIVGMFDVFIGVSLYHEARSLGFQSTAGQVTHSEVTRHADGDGDTFGVDIRYSYFVEGEKLEGAIYRYNHMKSSDSHWARQAVREHRVGADVAVYFDPQAPTDSVLKRGFDPSSLFMLLFLTPFNVVMLGIWWYGGPRLWHWWNGSTPQLIDWFSDGGRTHVRVSRFSALTAGAGTIGLAAFVAMFLVAFTAGFHPSMYFVLAAWAVVLAAGATGSVWAWRREREGAFDLVISSHDVDLPAMFDRKGRETIARSTIGGVAVEKIEKSDSDGDVSRSYAIKIERRGGGDAKIAEWYDSESAEALATWLREKLNLPKSAR